MSSHVEVMVQRLENFILGYHHPARVLVQIHTLVRIVTSLRILRRVKTRLEEVEVPSHVAVASLLKTPVLRAHRVLTTVLNAVGGPLAWDDAALLLGLDAWATNIALMLASKAVIRTSVKIACAGSLEQVAAKKTHSRPS